MSTGRSTSERDRMEREALQTALPVTGGLPPYPMVLGSGQLEEVASGCEVRRYQGVVFVLDRIEKRLVAASADRASARAAAKLWRRMLEGEA